MAMEIRQSLIAELKEPGRLNGSMQHWLGVDSPECQNPKSFAEVDLECQLPRSSNLSLS